MAEAKTTPKAPTKLSIELDVVKAASDDSYRVVAQVPAEDAAGVDKILADATLSATGRKLILKGTAGQITLSGRLLTADIASDGVRLGAYFTAGSGRLALGTV